MMTKKFMNVNVDVIEHNQKRGLKRKPERDKIRAMKYSLIYISMSKLYFSLVMSYFLPFFWLFNEIISVYILPVTVCAFSLNCTNLKSVQSGNGGYNKLPEKKNSTRKISSIIPTRRRQTLSSHRITTNHHAGHVGFVLSHVPLVPCVLKQVYLLS